MQKVADSVRGPVLKIGRLPEALPESFVTYRCFKVNPENAPKVQDFVTKVAEPLIRCKTYCGVKYWIIVFRKYSPRNCTRISRVPLECRKKSTVVKKFYYDDCGKVTYVANRHSLVKMA